MRKRREDFIIPELQEDPGMNEPVFDAFDEGVAMGGLRSRSEIMLLICYMLETIGSPVSVETITDVMQDEELANYFETMGAISELTGNGNIEKESLDGKEYLRLTEKGFGAVTVVADDLPRSVKETAVKSALHFQALERNMRDNHVKIEATNGGYNVSFAMTDKDTDLMKLTIFVADRDQAELLKNNFIEDPVSIYSTILTALMVD